MISDFRFSIFALGMAGPLSAIVNRKLVAI
jgi:hypothetical protein